MFHLTSSNNNFFHSSVSSNQSNFITSVYILFIITKKMCHWGNIAVNTKYIIVNFVDVGPIIIINLLVLLTGGTALQPST